MSREHIPDWIRFRREFESLLRGVWNTIGHLWDHQHELEQRIKRLEDETRPKERWHRD